MQNIDSIKFSTTMKVFITFLIFVLSILIIPSANAQKKQYVVVLDAGHGGHDPGNLGNGFREKNIALKVVLQVGKLLVKQQDIKVVYTRKKDVFIDLWKRGAIANTKKADLFVSIHCDSYTNNAYGAGTFVLGLRGNKKNLQIAKRENSVILMEDNYEKRYKGFDSNSAESIIGLSLLQEGNLDKSLEIASLIQYNFVNKLRRKDRKVKQDNFQVLRETIMPSVLVELGFLTNKREGRYLNSKNGQLQMATSIADAIKKYINQLKLNTVKSQVKIPTKNIKKVVAKKAVKHGVQFKIQLASGSTKLSTKSYNFKGLKDVERIKIGKLYKYYYGISSDYKTTKKALTTAKSKGYSTAFMVAFKNGKKISVNKAKKLQ